MAALIVMELVLHVRMQHHVLVVLQGQVFGLGSHFVRLALEGGILLVRLVLYALVVVQLVQVQVLALLVLQVIIFLEEVVLHVLALVLHVLAPLHASLVRLIMPFKAPIRAHIVRLQNLLISLSVVQLVHQILIMIRIKMEPVHAMIVTLNALLAQVPLFVRRVQLLMLCKVQAPCVKFVLLAHTSIIQFLHVFPARTHAQPAQARLIVLIVILPSGKRVLVICVLHVRMEHILMDKYVQIVITDAQLARHQICVKAAIQDTVNKGICVLHVLLSNILMVRCALPVLHIV